MIALLQMLLSQPDENSFVLDSLEGGVLISGLTFAEKTWRYCQHRVTFVNVQLVTNLRSNLCTAATRYSAAESNLT